MADDREKISTGPNEEPINETIAGTGPGIPDEALGPGEELGEAPATKKSRGSRKNSARLRRNETRYRSKVSKSRQMLTDDSVIVQFPCVSIAP